MKKLNIYISKQVLVGFLVITFCLLSILWLTQSLKFVELITNKGLPVSLFVEMTSLLMPRLFTILSPISLFIAVLFTYNRMLGDRELVVMKAAGISPWSNAKPALFIGILVALFNIYVNNFGIPQAEKTFNELEFKIKNDFSHLFFKEGEFTEAQFGLTIFVTSQEKDGSISGILVNDERDAGKKVTLSADKGRIINTDSTPRLILVKGSRQELDHQTGQFSSLSFDRYSVDFGESKFKKEKGIEARELSLKELLTAKNNPNLSAKEVGRFIVEGNKRILAPFYNILFALLGCTGLIVGLFNRRGQLKVILISLTAMVMVQAGDLAFTNMASKRLLFLPLMYLNFFIPLFACIYFLIFYNSVSFIKRKKRIHE